MQGRDAATVEQSLGQKVHYRTYKRINYRHFLEGHFGRDFRLNHAVTPTRGSGEEIEDAELVTPV